MESLSDLRNPTASDYKLTLQQMMNARLTRVLRLQGKEDATFYFDSAFSYDAVADNDRGIETKLLRTSLANSSRNSVIVFDAPETASLPEGGRYDEFSSRRRHRDDVISIEKKNLPGIDWVRCTAHFGAVLSSTLRAVLNFVEKNTLKRPFFGVMAIGKQIL